MCATLRSLFITHLLDVGFIDEELRRSDPGLGKLEDYCAVVDSLALARELHPGQKNSLDALCSRYEVDNSQRDLHGAVLDARLLADVYLRMTGGQTSLALAAGMPAPAAMARRQRQGERGPLPILKADALELKAHQARLAAIEKASEGNCLWLARPTLG